MKHTITFFAIFWAQGAFAHPGHLIEAAGHDHWLAGVAIGAAIAAGIWGALKGQRDEEEPKDDEPQEA